MSLLKDMVAGVLVWVNERLPIKNLWQQYICQYPVPKNLNIWYFFGFFGLVLFVNQILTGIWLTVYYRPTVEAAFDSIKYIMQEVPFGWLLRYLHSTGASFFFIVMYLHIFKALLYGSYQKPRELVWIIGMCIFCCLMAQSFFGYVLPWGNMSFWGAEVVTSLFETIPLIGEVCMMFIRGDSQISGMTLGRFFALHVIAIPLVLMGLVALHLLAIHYVGSNNPEGIDSQSSCNPNPQEGAHIGSVPFHPYYTVKNLAGLAIFLLIFCTVVFFAPEMGGLFLEPANLEPANPLNTPPHIKPIWYMAPYYAMLRCIPNKAIGVLVTILSWGIWFGLPWLDKSPVRSVRYRGFFYKAALALWVGNFILLGYLGTQPLTNKVIWVARLATILYFSFFVFMPVYTKRGCHQSRFSPQ